MIKPVGRSSLYKVFFPINFLLCFYLVDRQNLVRSFQVYVYHLLIVFIIALPHVLLTQVVPETDMGL